jgi:RNA polymerase sigma factor for flagellar operon FliA
MNRAKCPSRKTMKKPGRNYAPPPLDEEVRNRILMEQMPQVRYIARHVHDRLPQHVPIEDLVHAGVLGLMDALNKYDEARQVQFKTYAKFRIRGAILDSLRELDWSPRDLRRKARMIEATSARLSHELGRAPSEQEIAAGLGLGLEAFQHLLSELEGLDLGSFHIESSGGEQDDDLCEYLPGDPEESPYLLTMKSELHSMLVRAIEELSEKEQRVLSLYYYEELTMKEAGAVLGIGESRVSQIHSLALLRLRTRLQSLLAGRQMPPHLADQAVHNALGGVWKKY